jgi:hypothetical protein
MPEAWRSKQDHRLEDRHGQARRKGFHGGIFMPISDEKREERQYEEYRDRREGYGDPTWVDVKPLAEAADDLFDLYVPGVTTGWAHSAGPQPLPPILAQAGTILASRAHNKVCITAAGVSP